MNFSLIIPTYNRAEYLERILKYYLKVQLVKFQIIVCDSSEQKAENEYLYFDNVTYLYDKNLTYTEKMMKALSIASTKYIFIGADDDYLIPDTLYKMEGYLYQDNINSIDGATMTVNEDLEITPSGFYLKSTISSDDVITRLSQFFRRYYPIYYSGYRKEFLIEFFATLKNSNIQNVYLLEHLLAAMSLIRGAHITLDEMYFVRGVAPSKMPDKIVDSNRIENIYDKNNQDYDNFLSIISHYLVEHSNYEYNQAYNLIKNIFENDLIKSSIKNKQKYYDVRQSSNLEKKIKLFLCKITNTYFCERLNKIHWNYRKNRLLKKLKHSKGYPFFNKKSEEEWIKIKNNILGT